MTFVNKLVVLDLETGVTDLGGIGHRDSRINIGSAIIGAQSHASFGLMNLD